jgi:hypothetical protein
MRRSALRAGPSPLSWKAQLNQRCDELATLHLESATSDLPLVPFLPFLPASRVELTVAGTSITHHYPSQLRTLAELPAYRVYLCHHHGRAPAVFDLVDWPTFHSCTLTVPFLQRLFIIKWVNDLLPFQVQQHKFNQSPSPLCLSSCGEPEDWRHFPRCPHQACALLWRSYSTTIAKTFNTWEIGPSLRRLLLYWLARFSDSDPIPLDNLPDDYTMSKTTQEEIGEDSILFGYFSHDWVKLQHRYLTACLLPSSRNQAS